MGQTLPKDTLQMGIFSKTATTPDEEALKKARDAERVLRDQTDARLIAARKTYIDRQYDLEKSRKALADDKTLDGLSQKAIIAERHVVGFESDLIESNARLAKLEADLHQLRKARQSKIDADKVAALKVRCAENASNLLKAAALVAADCKEIRDCFMDDCGRGHHVTATIIEAIPPAVARNQENLQAHIAAVLGGAAAMPYSETFTPLPPAAPPAETIRVFSTHKPIKWIAADGALHTERKWTSVDLPPATAQCALAWGMVVTEGHPLRKQMLDYNANQYGSGTEKLPPYAKPAASDCVDLDGPAPPDAKPVAVSVNPSANVARVINPAPATRSDPRVVEPTKFDPAPLPPGFERLPVGPRREIQIEGVRNLDIVARNNSREDKS
jgi:hypothetical protein